MPGSTTTRQWTRGVKNAVGVAQQQQHTANAQASVEAANERAAAANAAERAATAAPAQADTATAATIERVAETTVRDCQREQPTRRRKARPARFGGIEARH
jgi:guanyl-specific ribonuclease Sa